MIELLIRFYNVNASNFWILPGDGGNEFFKVNSSISVLISIINHLINLLRSESLSNHFANLFEIFRSKAVSSIGIKNFIDLLK